jgi:putative DNA primase/helicase
MRDDDSSTPNVFDFPNIEEERLRRLQREAERLAGLTAVEQAYWVERDGYAKEYGTDKATLKRMVGAAAKEQGKKAREAKADDLREKRQVERKQERDDKRSHQEQERARKKAERDRKEADRLAREEETKRKERETAFAEIADLPKLTHEVRLRELAARRGEDFEYLVQEFEVHLAARTIPEDLTPWDEAVDTAELLAAIETKFRRHVVASEAVIVAATMWTPFTYVVEIATHAPKLLLTFPEKDAGKSTALGVLQWMVQRPYPAVEATGAAIFRIVDRLKPTLLLDEGDTLFRRSTVLAHIINSSWTNNGAKIPRAKASGTGYDEYDVYGAQAISMRGTKAPDTTLSRCIICMIWPKLAGELVDKFTYKDDDEFKVIRRKLQRWAIDNAVALRAAKPEFPPGFNNRVQTNWEMLLVIADLADGEWPKRVRNAALELETGRDEPSEMTRLFAALRDGWGKAQKRTSKSLCAVLAAHPSGEYADFRGKGPLSQHQLAALLRPFGIKPEHNLHLAGSAKDNQGGYLRSQFENAWARLLQKPSKDSLTRSPRRKRQ